MSEEEPKLPNPWDVDLSNCKEFKFATDHTVGHDPIKKREIFIQFQQAAFAEGQKPNCLARIVITPQHATELILNLQNQISKLRSDGENPKPPKRF